MAIPVLNGGPGLQAALAAVNDQRTDRELEIVVCDSGSTDGSVAIARSCGATVIEIAPSAFSHGATRNLLMRRCAGEHVAFLTQDSVPADARWLAHLLAGFAEADDVALTFGPYRPQTTASPMVARELNRWFEWFSPDGSPVVDRLAGALLASLAALPKKQETISII